MDTKQCSRCKETKPLDDFNVNRSSKTWHGRQSHCKACGSKTAMEWNKAHPEQFRRNQRNSAIRRQFGLEPEEYQSLLDRQGGVCGICKRQPEHTFLSVDHDHVTGLVRGLLCQPCNVALGAFGDSVDGLQAAIAYLSTAY